MMFFKNIFILLFFISCNAIAQNTFSNLDTLLYKAINAVNSNDSASYLAMLHQPTIFKTSNCKSHKDSLLSIKHFLENFQDLRSTISEIATNNDFTVNYEGYQLRQNIPLDIKQNGNNAVYLILLINNTFTIKIPFVFTINDELYLITIPFMPMVLNED